MSPAASSSPPDAARAFDRLAEALLRAVPERVEAARAAGELVAVHRLRHAHVVAHGWGPASADGLERDEADARAVQIGAWSGAELVGTLRVVPPAADRPLPVEEAFDLHVEPRGEVVEVGRLVIAPAWRGDPAHRVWGALFARAWLEVRARGHRVIAGMASQRLIEVYRAQGLAVEVLGPARQHRGQARHPIRLEPAAGGVPSWFGR